MCTCLPISWNSNAAVHEATHSEVTKIDKQRFSCKCKISSSINVPDPLLEHANIHEGTEDNSVDNDPYDRNDGIDN